MKSSLQYCACVGLLMLVSLKNCVYANYEHFCYRDDYEEADIRNMYLCGRMLIQFIMQSCPAPSPDDESTWFYSRTAATQGNGVFVSRESANSVLDLEQQPNTGMLCECCVHRCRAREVSQYCASPKKLNLSSRRRRRSILTSATQSTRDVITQRDVDRFYSLLDELKPFVGLFQRDPIAEENAELHTLDQHKRQAVQGNMRQKMPTSPELEKNRAIKSNHRHPHRHHRRHRSDRHQKRG